MLELMCNLWFVICDFIWVLCSLRDELFLKNGIEKADCMPNRRPLVPSDISTPFMFLSLMERSHSRKHLGAPWAWSRRVPRLPRHCHQNKKMRQFLAMTSPYMPSHGARVRTCRRRSGMIRLSGVVARNAKNKNLSLPRPAGQHDRKIHDIHPAIQINVRIHITRSPEKYQYGKINEVYFAIAINIGSVAKIDRLPLSHKKPYRFAERTLQNRCCRRNRIFADNLV